MRQPRQKASVGKVLRCARILAGRTQREIAVPAGMSASALGAIERDWRQPRPGEIDRIIRVLLNPSDMLRGLEREP